MKKLSSYLASFLLLSLLIGADAFAQSTIKVTGTVTDAADGMGVPGASVLQKGTSNGTITNMDGQFTLEVPTDAVLVISFIGYKTAEIPVQGRSTVQLALESDVTELSEVVVVGYGSQEKGDVTGVVTAVDSKEFNKGAIVSPDQLLAGKVAGVQITQSTGEPGGKTSIRIRGGTSINASNEPLFVIDGVPIDNSSHDPGGFSGGRNPLNFINPADIETFTVLKDASATAIYGSRGANGVIIITTKKGKAGEGIRVNYDGYVNVSRVNTSNMNVLGAEEFRNVVTAKGPSKLPLLGNRNTNWFDEVVQDAVGYSHSLSVTGGAENMGYRASIGYQNLDGVIKTSNTERTSYAFSMNQSLLDGDLQINTNLKGAATSDRFAPGVVGAAYAFDPTQPILDPESPWGGFFEYQNDLAPDNPVSSINQTQDFGESFRNIGNVEFDYMLPFVDGLSAKLNLGFDINTGERERFQPSTLRNQSVDNGELRRENYKRVSKLLDAYVNYKKYFEGIDSEIDFTVGYSYQDFTGEFPRFRAWDLETDIFGLNSTNPARENITATSIEENRLISFFGRMNYSLKDKYLLTLTLRRDGSSRFGESNRWGMFPSAAFAWRVLDEGFAESLNNVFSDLKLRVGYGVTGNQEIGNYRYLATYTNSDNMASYQLGNQFYSTLRPNAYDAGLKWEETASYNIGLDFGFMNGRINGALEYYYKRTDDLLFEVAVPAGANLTNILLTNIGSVENQGVELSLNAVAIDKPDFNWSLGFNIAYNRNEILSLDQLNDPSFQGYQTGGISGGVGNNIQILKVGEPVNSFFTYTHLMNGDQPLPDGVDHNGDGVINLADMYANVDGEEIVNDNDKSPNQDPAPDIIMGLTSNMSYKNFDLSFTLRSNIGNHVYNNIASNYGHFNRANTLVVPENMHTSVLYSGFNNPQYFSDFYLENASFLRLDNITLGYNIPAFDKMNFRVYGTVQNAFILTEYSGFDPEIQNGIDNNLYPRPTNYILGVNLNF